MKPPTPPIDSLSVPGGRDRLAWACVGMAGGVLGAVYLFGVNRNLLYLSLLFSVAVMMSAVLRRWWALGAGIGFCGFLACVPAKVVDLGPLYPAPRDRPGAENLWVTPIGEGETWTYRFALDGLQRISANADLAGYLYIDGRNLSGLVVGVQGETVEGAPVCSKKNGFDHLVIPLRNERAGALTVSLKGTPGTPSRIFHGPEVHGPNVYGDAVWLEFTSGRDRMIYEASRAAAAPKAVGR
jgi:hypothetical protein